MAVLTLLSQLLNTDDAYTYVHDRGRHPCLEAKASGGFIPNDLDLGANVSHESGEDKIIATG
jgi:DNA mismatch repair ATPase MutS